jgi:tRNA modification GTPase
MLTVFFGAGPVVDLASAAASDTAAFAAWFHHLLEGGVWWPPSQFEAAFLSAALDDDALGHVAEVAAAGFEAVASIATGAWPAGTRVLSGRLDDTIAAIATAPGVGAIGIVRVAGPEALRVAAAVFRPARGLDVAALPGGRVTFGHVVDTEAGAGGGGGAGAGCGAGGGEFVDDGLLLTFRGPASYTGQDAVELQVHGGPAVLRAVLDLCLRHGARAAEPGEFTLRAVAHGKLDLAQAEAVLAMVEARSDAARRQASIGLSGALGEAIAAAETAITAAYAAVLAQLDYPEEGVPEAQVEAAVAAARGQLERLLATADAGRFAVRGARLAIVGRPNAGKSSLLNALLGYERAIVAAAPGTTRDYLEAPLELGRVSVTAVDTAGLRTTDDAIEAHGVARSRALAAAADAVVALVDGARPWTTTTTRWSKRSIPPVPCGSPARPTYRPPGTRPTWGCPSSASRARPERASTTCGRRSRRACSVPRPPRRPG